MLLELVERARAVTNVLRRRPSERKRSNRAVCGSKSERGQVGGGGAAGGSPITPRATVGAYAAASAAAARAQTHLIVVRRVLSRNVEDEVRSSGVVFKKLSNVVDAAADQDPHSVLLGVVLLDLLHRVRLALILLLLRLRLQRERWAREREGG